jgi:hypothetical protein
MKRAAPKGGPRMPLTKHYFLGATKLLYFFAGS